MVPVKKNASAVVVSDKYNLKPIPLKRQRCGPCCGFSNGRVCACREERRGESAAVDGSFSHSSIAALGDAAPPAEKKYKPLNTTPNATKEIKVKIIPPQRESKTGGCAGKWEQALWKGDTFLQFSLEFLVSFNVCNSGIPFITALHRVT